MKRIIIAFLLIPSFGGAQTFEHSVLVGFNSSSRYRVANPHIGHHVWGGAEHRWGWGGGYRMEYSLSRAMSAGVSAEYVRTRSLLYHDCNCTYIGLSNTYKNTISISEVSLPLFLKLRVGKGARGYSYLLGGMGVDGILQAHRRVENQVESHSDGISRTLIGEGTFDLKNPSKSAMGTHYRVAVGRHFRLKEGLSLLVELGFRRNLNEWVYHSFDVRDRVGEYRFKRQWGYFMIGVGL